MNDLQQQLRANDVLANERTYLAYVRTSLAFVAFGFVIARFSLFEREFDVMMHRSPSTTGAATIFGTAMAVFGVLIAVVGAWRYAATHKGLREGKVISMPGLGAYIMTLFIGAVGLAVAYAILATK